MGVREAFVEEFAQGEDVVLVHGAQFGQGEFFGHAVELLHHGHGLARLQGGELDFDEFLRV